MRKNYLNNDIKIEEIEIKTNEISIVASEFYGHREFVCLRYILQSLKKGHSCMIFSLNQTKDEMIDMLIANAMIKNDYSVIRKNLEDDEKSEYNIIKEWLLSMPLTIYDGHFTSNDIVHMYCKKEDHQLRKDKPSLIYIDDTLSILRTRLESNDLYISLEMIKRKETAVLIGGILKGNKLLDKALIKFANKIVRVYSNETKIYNMKSLSLSIGKEEYNLNVSKFHI